MALTNIQAIQNYQGAYTPKILATLYDELTIPKTPGIAVMNGLTVDRQLYGYEALEGITPLNLNVEDTTRKSGTILLRTISPRRAQKILKIIPDELVDTFLYEGTPDLTQNQPPMFAQMYWDAQMKKIGEEIEEQSFNMKDKSAALPYVAANSYAVGDAVLFTDSEYYVCTVAATANQSPATHLDTKWDWASNRFICDGWNTVLKKEITDAKIVPVTTGAITAANAVEKIDGLMWNATSQKMRRKGVFVYVSWDVYDKRIKALRALKASGQFYTEADIMELKDYVIDSSRRAKIIPCHWMGTSQRVIISLDRNLVMGTNSLNSTGVFGNNVPILHGYKTIMKYTLAFQFDDLRYLVTNEQL